MRWIAAAWAARRSSSERRSRRKANMDANPDQVLLESLDRGLLTLTLNRPERRNALNPELGLRLVDAATLSHLADPDGGRGVGAGARHPGGPGRGARGGRARARDVAGAGPEHRARLHQAEHQHRGAFDDRGRARYRSHEPRALHADRG